MLTPIIQTAGLCETDQGKNKRISNFPRTALLRRPSNCLRSARMQLLRVLSRHLPDSQRTPRLAVLRLSQRLVGSGSRRTGECTGRCVDVRREL